MSKANIKDQTDPGLPLVIVNPHSAAGSTRERWAGVASDIRRHFGPFSVEFTTGPGHAVELARNASAAGRKFIVACGGDGTINEVANGIIRSGGHAELGVLPSGTGGDFRRTLRLPSSLAAAAEALRNGITQDLDAGKVEFAEIAGGRATRYFVNVASIGLAAAIIGRVKSRNSLDWLPIGSLRGKANFAYSTLQEVMDVEPVRVRVRIDNAAERTVPTIALCIANARYFGGGMKIAPNAKISDGLLDVINIGDIGTARILVNAYSLYNGTHLSLKEVASSTAQTVTVSPVDGSEIPILETDGEIVGSLPAVFTSVPAALRVRTPR